MAALPVSPEARRLRRLMAVGYFPPELPPPFVSKLYAAQAAALAAKWSTTDIRKFWSAAENYSVPRYGQARRKLSIVNPVNQLYVANIIAVEWSNIKARLSRSKISEFRPEISTLGPGRAVPGVNFDGVARRRVEILSNYGRYIKTDITRFYASIYTHSIAWAILGKEWCKQNHHAATFKNSYANALDKAVSAGQRGQTMGIPIGPDTSRILSEIIATEIETILRLKVPDIDERAVRYVDDFIVGFGDVETSGQLLSAISTSIEEYELELSAPKTTIHGLGSNHSPEWIHFIREYKFNSASARQR